MTVLWLNTMQKVAISRCISRGVFEDNDNDIRTSSNMNRYQPLNQPSAGSIEELASFVRTNDNDNDIRTSSNMNRYQPLNQPSAGSIEELASFVRTNGSSILEKTCKFSLSTSSLVHLNKCFKSLIDDQVSRSSTQTNREQDVAYLLDFFQKTNAVKLIHGTLTLQRAIDLSHFIALTFLEIKGVPVHFLVGLKALRHQLEILICSRSITSISALFKSCGGDMASEASWSSLHTVNLSHNHIDKLDDSLKLLPSLKVLDLSHNNIRHTRHYLEDLSEITHLNLAFNQMETIPVLGLVARVNLKSLSLKHNNLESLAGLTDFTGLEVLDVATNCIFDRMELRMLGYLQNLKAVYLYGNPLNYDPVYRLMVVKSLPAQASRNKTKIDGVALTPREAKMVSRDTYTPSPIPRRRSSWESINALEYSLYADISSFDESMDRTISKPMMHKERKSKGKRSLRKVKHAAIADPAKAHLNINTSVVTSDSDIEGTKQKVEDMRKHHGSDWLLALQAPYNMPTLDSMPNDDNSTNQIEQPTQVKIRQHYDAEIQGGTKQLQGTVKELIEQEKMTVVEINRESDKSLAEKNDSKINIYPVKSHEPEVLEIQDNQSTGEDQELLSPLVVTVYPKDKSEQVKLFLTVKIRYLEERDILGQVTEVLDLVSLKGMQKTEDTLKDSEMQTFVIVPVVKLTFDYIRRDRQKRKYFMENEESCMALVNILQPFVARNQAIARQKSMMQCLKCSAEFHRQDAMRIVHKIQRNGILQNTQGSQDDNSSSDIESMNEVIVCPECSSSMLLNLEHDQQAMDFVSNQSTPIGSLTSLEMNTKPLAMSSPWKPLDQDSTCSSSADYQSAEGSPSPSICQTAHHITNSMTSVTLPNNTQMDNNNDKILTTSVTDTEPPSSPTKRSLLGNFNLPEATLHMSIGDSSVGDISPYPPEKLSQMLYTGVKGFDQKYSLVPSNLLGSASSTDVFRPSSQHSTGSDADIEQKGRIMPVGYPNKKAGGSVRLNKESMLAGNPPQFPVQIHSDNVKSAYEGTNSRTRKPSGAYSEDDIEVLEPLDSETTTSTGNGQNVYPWLRSESHVRTDNRKDSNDSDIAVIVDHTNDFLPKSDGASDTVFDSGHGMQTNLASALSDVAGCMQSLSPVAELGRNVCDQETSSNSTNNSDLHVSVNVPNSHILSQSNGVRKPTGLSMEYSCAESQIKDSIYSHINRRRLSALDDDEVDFSQVDHRLKLHFDMTYFGDDEEFKCMIEANIYQLSKTVDYKGYLLVSSHNMFILKIVKEDSDSQSDRLMKRAQHPIKDLLFVHVGLGSQSFQLEFNNDGILYTVVVRNKKWCEQFLSQLTDVICNSSSDKIKFKGLVRDHPNTLANLMCQVFGALMSDDSQDVPDVDTNLTLYILAFRKIIKETKKSTALQLEPVGIVVTASQIFLVQENHLWPLHQSKGIGRFGRGQGSQQFIYHSQHAITDISGLELYEDAMCDMTIVFSVEETGEDIHWHIQTATTSSMAALMSAIQSPWQQLFGVAMPQIIHPSVTLQDEM